MNLVHSFILSAGFPPSPSNLSYSYGVCNGTHFLTTFNWSNPMESRRSLAESYVLTLTSTDNISRSVVNSNTTSITIPLNYQSMLVYTATVYSSSCGEVLESKNNPSINVTFTQCKNLRFYNALLKESYIVLFELYILVCVHHIIIVLSTLP